MKISQSGVDPFPNPITGLKFRLWLGNVVFSSPTERPNKSGGAHTLHMDLYIFRRDAPKRPWELVKKVPLPRPKEVPPISYRTALGTGGAAEVWMLEADSEQAARGRLEAKLRAKTN